jgi:CheY-like chemotaxis protein
VDAQAGKLAIEFAQNLLPDLIILDIQLPDMDGWDVLQKIHQDVNLQSIPVIVLSVDPEFARAAEFNVEYTFTKPIDTTLLLETVNSLFSQPHVEKQGE